MILLLPIILFAVIIVVKIMPEHSELPFELLNGLEEPRRTQSLGRFLVMQELRLPFTPEATLKIARDEVKGRDFWSAIRKNWVDLHGDEGGLLKADVEIAAVTLDVYDVIFPPRSPRNEARAQRNFNGR